MGMTFWIFLFINFSYVKLCQPVEGSNRPEGQRGRLHIALEQLLDGSHHTAMQMGILSHQQLVFAEGHGRIAGNHVDAAQTMPLLDLSKALTAIAILQLAESEYLSLEETIFSSGDLIEDFVLKQPSGIVDPRIRDITIHHLLEGSAGWDETTLPMMDPMLNSFLIAQGYDVPNIKEEMADIYDQYTIIKYMVGKTLSFTPGTKSVHCNICYSVLGRVIEAASGVAYEEYIIHNILKQAGMFHTKIGSSENDLLDFFELSYPEIEHQVKERNMDNMNRNMLAPNILDSTLGWYSNIYDIARLYVSLQRSEKKGILDRNSLEIGISREYFRYTGLTSQSSANISMHHDVYNSFMFVAPTESGRNPNNIIIFLGNKQLAVDKIESLLKDITLEEDITSLHHNLFVEDLGGFSMQTGSKTVIIETKIDIDKLETYSNAMQIAGYFPLWIYGYTEQLNTYFVAVFQKAELDHEKNFYVTTSDSEGILWRRVAENVRFSYQVSLVQSFSLATNRFHGQHLLVMKQRMMSGVVKFDYAEKLRQYDVATRYYEAEGFHPIVQNIYKPARKSFVSYIWRRQSTPTRHNNSLTMEQLEIEAIKNAEQNYFITYLDVIENRHHSSRFSVIFSHRMFPVEWLLQPFITMNKLESECLTRAAAGYLPQIVLPISGYGPVNFLVYWQSSQ